MIEIFDDYKKLGNQILNSEIKEWINSGKKVIGYYCNSLPEAIIHAAGFLPFRIRGIENYDFNKSDSILSKFNCTYVRSTFNLALNDKYNFLNGLVVANTCDHVRRMYDMYKLKIEKVIKGDLKLFFLSYPHLFSNEGWEWMRNELELFKKNLENSFKITIHEEDLRNSLKIYQENRELMNKIENFRNLEYPILSGEEFFQISIANTSIRKEKSNEMLKQIINELENRKPIENVRARLLLLGSSVDNSEFIKILEHSGGVIVGDAICTGAQSFSNKQMYEFPFENNESSSIIDELVKNTYGRTFCPRMMNGHKARFNWIKKLIKDLRIDGIILQRIEFCDLHGTENAIYENEIKNELNVPVLRLDREYFLGDTGRLRTRVEAFLEKLGR